MKVAILSYGHFASIMPLAKAMAKDHDVCLLLMVHGMHFSESIGTFDMEGLQDGMHSRENTFQFLDDQIAEYLGEKLKVNLFKYPSLKVNHVRNYQLSLNLAKYLKKEKYEIVHFNGIKFFQFIICIFLRNTKTLWTIHDPFLHSGEEKNKVRLIYKILSIFRKNIILHNRSNLDEFIRTYSIPPSKVHFIPYPPLDIFNIYQNKNISLEPNTILFFGRFSKYKGIEYLIQASILARKKITNLKVIIAGSGNYQVDLESIKNNPLFEIHHRYIPNTELVEFIQRASVIACPYTDATQSGVIMTAYALRKPVIASSVGGIPEVVKNRETGLLIPPMNTEALANAIIEILANKVLLQKYSTNIDKRYFTGNFSWASISKELINIYQNII